MRPNTTKFLIKAEYDEESDTIFLDFGAAPDDPELRRLLAQAFAAAGQMLIARHYN